MAFVVFRDLTPPRSLYHLAEVLDLDVRSLQGWSQRWNWVERADAYTAHLDDPSTGGTSADELIRRRRETTEQLYAIARDLLMSAIAA